MADNGKLGPDDLVSVGGPHRLSKAAAPKYLAMVAAAAAAGITINITDSYRSYDQQVQLVKEKGLYKPGKGGGGAVPGTSKHGWGEAVDMNTNAAGYAWLQQHAAEYGFVADTPGEKWHYSYTGPDSVAGGKSTLGSIGKSRNVAQGPPTGTSPYVSSSGGSIDDVAREQYGYLAAYLDDPEIGPILRQAAEQNWSPQKLQGALYPTQWWQNTQSSARTWDAAYAQDPATVDAQIQQQMADLKAQAAKLGFVIDVGHLHDLARDSLRLGWDQTQIANAIGAESFRNGKLSTSTTMQGVRQAVSDYGIPMSDATMNDWGAKIAQGEVTTEDLRQQLVNMAKGLFPGVADQLDKGLTVRQLADPYIQLAAQTLEIGPDTIDFKDPKWSAALNGVDSKGVRRSLTLGEWSDKIKADASYGWSKTKGAQAQAFDLSDTLGKAFGKVPS